MDAPIDHRGGDGSVAEDPPAGQRQVRPDDPGRQMGLLGAGGANRMMLRASARKPTGDQPSDPCRWRLGRLSRRPRVYCRESRDADPWLRSEALRSNFAFQDRCNVVLMGPAGAARPLESRLR